KVPANDIRRIHDKECLPKQATKKNRQIRKKPRAMPGLGTLPSLHGRRQWQVRALSCQSERGPPNAGGRGRLTNEEQGAIGPGADEPNAKPPADNQVAWRFMISSRYTFSFFVGWSEKNYEHRPIRT